MRRWHLREERRPRTVHQLGHTTPEEPSATISAPRAALLLAALVLGFPTRAQAQDHLRVVWHDRPATEAIVSWSTSGPAMSTSIRLIGPGGTAQEIVPTQSGPYDDDFQTTYHHARLEGLKPSSRVDFEIVTEAGSSERRWFRTAPADARPFVLLYGGDSRSDREVRRIMNRRLRDLADADPSVIALAHGGDYIGNGRDWLQWRGWLEDWQETTSSDGRVLPIIPARGNHEADGVHYNRVFGFPGVDTGGDWWATPIGPDFMLLTLDTNASMAGSQRSWLDQQLRDGQKYRWIAANYHRPAYPAVKSPGGALYHWVPLFEQYNVDFVLESDGHVLKRTVPIRDGIQHPTGVVYLGEGGLGVPQRVPDTDRWYLKPPGMAQASHHVQALRVTPDTVYYSAIDANGKVLDTWEFKPRRKGQYREPTIRSASWVDAERVRIEFTNALSSATAEQTSAYRFVPPLVVRTATYDPTSQSVELVVDRPVDDAYRLSIDGVLDAAGKEVPLTTASFAGLTAAKLPVPGRVEVLEPRASKDSIRELPVGPSKAPQEPPLLSCSASSRPRPLLLWWPLLLAPAAIHRRRR